MRALYENRDIGNAPAALIPSDDELHGAVMDFELIGPISGVERIAIGSRLRQLRWLCRDYGPGDWVKRKGVARVRIGDGTIRVAEVHWYEAHGIGRKDLKIKRYVDQT